MKKVIYGVLIATSITQTAVYASQKPQRPTTPAPMNPGRLTPSTCPDDLNMEQLNELKAGTLKLGGHDFKLHTSKKEFDAMLPGKLQIISKGSSLAHMNKTLGRTTVSTPKGPIVKCSYTFRTATGSKLGKAPTPFSIVSEPQEGKPLPEELVEALGKQD